MLYSLLSNCSIYLSREPKSSSYLAPDHNGSCVTENPESLPPFITEHIMQHLINQKEEDNLRAEDWKNFKSGASKKAM